MIGLSGGRGRSGAGESWIGGHPGATPGEDDSPARHRGGSRSRVCADGEQLAGVDGHYLTAWPLVDSRRGEAVMVRPSQWVSADLLSPSGCVVPSASERDSKIGQARRPLEVPGGRAGLPPDADVQVPTRSTHGGDSAARVEVSVCRTPVVTSCRTVSTETYGWVHEMRHTAN